MKTYCYIAFGIPIISEIELPALLPLEDVKTIEDNPVYVKIGKVPERISGEGQAASQYGFGNAHEMLFNIPDRIHFYITNGNQVIIEPIKNNKGNSLLFYSFCLTTLLFQRNRVPFHVSGVFLKNKKVALFAAPSRTGKSTLSVKLQEMGYQPFTDDTAAIFVENGKCYAQASYPMIRIWQNSLNQQQILQDADKQPIYEDDDEIDKYGFSFHQKFVIEPVEVAQIVFLKEEGTEIEAKPVNNTDAFITLSNNVFGTSLIAAMQKNILQFNTVTQILKTVPCTLACRPKNKNSFEEFPKLIEKILLNESF